MGAADLLLDLRHAGISVAAIEGKLLVTPASALTDAHRAELRERKSEVLALFADGDPDATPAVVEDAAPATVSQMRLARALRMGLDRTLAEVAVHRLLIRDRDADRMVSCIECGHQRPGRCGNHRQARLSTADVGSDLAAMLQRCPGFVLVAELAVNDNPITKELGVC